VPKGAVVIVIEKDRWLLLLLLLLLLLPRRKPEKKVGLLVGAPAHHPLPGARVNAASRQDQVKVRCIVQAPVGQKMPPASGNQVLDHDRLLGLCAVERPVLSPKMGQLLLLLLLSAFAKDVEGAGGVGEVRQLCKQQTTTTRMKSSFF
jgi:hypothetical protein